jgi:hypothetical protein
MCRTRPSGAPTLQKAPEAYGGAKALGIVHGKKNELGIASESFAVTLQVRHDPFVLRSLRGQDAAARRSRRSCSNRRHVLPQRFLFGYEFPDTVMLLAEGTLYVHATAKKRECGLHG